MAWPQAVVFAWMAVSGLMEIAMINNDLDKIRMHQRMHRDGDAAIYKELQGADNDEWSGRILTDLHQQYIQSSLNIESTAKWKAVGFTMRVFAVRLVILVALHSGGFF